MLCSRSRLLSKLAPLHGTANTAREGRWITKMLFNAVERVQDLGAQVDGAQNVTTMCESRRVQFGIQSRAPACGDHLDLDDGAGS